MTRGLRAASLTPARLRRGMWRLVHQGASAMALLGPLIRRCGRMLQGARRRFSLTQMLVAVSGSNHQVLEDAPGERVKQAALGGVILTTAGMAGMSFAFALRMALHAPSAVAVVLGLLWALAIANLDRWLITATTRQPTAWGNIRLALPRVLLALIIGLVVSTPLTLQIFSSEINDELTFMQAEAKAHFEQQLSIDPRYRDLPAQRAQLMKLENEVAQGVPDSAAFDDPAVVDLRTRLAAVDKLLVPAQQAVICEQEGKCGSGRPGSGPAYAEKVKLRDRLQSQHDQLQAQLTAKSAEVQASLASSEAAIRMDRAPELAQLRARISATQTARDAEVARNNAAVSHGDGLLARLEALDRISARNPQLLLAHLALFLFFTAIECLPVLFKLLLSFGKPSLYEALLALGDEAILAETQLRLEAKLAQAEVEASTALEAHETRMRNQLQAEVDIAKSVLDSQTELGRRAVALWKAEQERLIRNDVGAFVSTANARGPFDRQPSRQA